MTEKHVHNFIDNRCEGCGTGAMGQLYKQLADERRGIHDTEHVRWPEKSCSWCNPPVTVYSLQVALAESEALVNELREDVKYLRMGLEDRERMRDLWHERAGNARDIINEALQMVNDDIGHGGSRAAPSSGCLACEVLAILERYGDD